MSPFRFTFPVPLGVILMSSFDLVPVMLLSLNVTPGKTTAPVPPGLKVKSALLGVTKVDPTAVMSPIPVAVKVPVMFPVTFRSPSILTFSFRLIVELSVLEILVPLKLNASMLTPPVPLPVISTEPFVAIVVIESPFIES